MPHNLFLSAQYLLTSGDAMIWAISPSGLTFEEYVDVCVQTEERYELVRGELVKMNPPKVSHYRIAKVLERVFDEAIAIQFPPETWETFREVGQRTDVNNSRLPDLAIVSQAEANQLLQQTAIFQSPALLVVEIVSPGSVRDDYGDKLREYEALGIGEYWIVDHEALGTTKQIGFPKEPTISVHELVDGCYQLRQFRGSDRILSPTFLNLDVTAEQIFEAGRSPT